VDVDRRRDVEVRIGDRAHDAPRGEVRREPDDRDLVVAVLDDVERPPEQEDAVAVRDRRAAEVDLLRRAGGGVDPEERAGGGQHRDERLAVRRRVDAVDVEVRTLAVVAGEIHRGERPAGATVRPQRHAVQDRLERVGEPRRPLRDDDVVDEAAAAGQGKRRDERSRLRAVDVRLPGGAARDEQAAAVDLHPDRCVAGHRGQERALARAEAAAIDVARRDRADVERVACDRDPLGLEPVRQVDAARNAEAEQRRPRHQDGDCCDGDE